MADAQIGGDRDKQQGAGDDCAKRAGKDTGQPETMDRIQLQEDISDAKRGDDHAERTACGQISKSKLFGHQIARCCARRKGEQDRERPGRR
jgi:hypothetical protein